jgi:hypothetical protein
LSTILKNCEGRVEYGSEASFIRVAIDTLQMRLCADATRLFIDTTALRGSNRHDYHSDCGTILLKYISPVSVEK